MEATGFRRKVIYPHKSIRHMPFQAGFLLQAILVALGSDLLLLWKIPQILTAHSRFVEFLLGVARVPWQTGREIILLPGVGVELLQTRYLDYRVHPLYPWLFLGITAGVFLAGFRYWPAPLKPLLFLVPASLAITLFYLKAVSPSVPYTPEDFCAIWYRGETYLWFLLPWIFALGLFTLNVPFILKLPWLALMVGYSLVWSALRLALALGTFHYFGPIWMPLFYFAFGFLADFLYIVAFYSLAMDRAATFLRKQKQVWQA